MALRKWTIAGIKAANRPYQWAFARQGLAMDDRTRIVMQTALERPPGVSVLSFQHWADVELAEEWIRRAADQPASRIALFPDQRARQEAVTTNWHCFANACRAMNIRPYALRLFREACTAAFSIDMKNDTAAVRESTWRARAYEAYFRSVPRENWIAGDAVVIDCLRAWVSEVGQALATCPAPIDDGAWDVSGYDFTGDTYTLTDGSYATRVNPHITRPAMSWHQELIEPVINWMREQGPLGVIWNTQLDVAVQNLAVMREQGLSGSEAQLLDRVAELSDLAETQAQTAQRRDMATAFGMAAAATVILGPAAPLAAAIVGIIGSVAELVNTMLPHAVQIRFDCFGRRYPTLEALRISDSGLNADDTSPPSDIVAQMPPNPPGWTPPTEVFLNVPVLSPMQPLPGPTVTPPPSSDWVYYVGGGLLLTAGVALALSRRR